jgi:hypothetical protein
MATKKIFLGADGQIRTGTEVGVPVSLPIQHLEDSADQTFYRSIEVPLGYTAISAITFRYRTTHAGNLYLKFAVSHVAAATGSTPTEDTYAYAVYAGAGTGGEITNITVPATAYDVLGTLAAGDVLSIAVERDATDSLDTYTSNLDCVGFLVEFTVATVSGGTVAAATNAIVTLDELKDFLGISLTDTAQDDFLQLWINESSNEIEEWIDNKAKSQTITNETGRGNGRYKYRPKYYPIVAIGIVGATDAQKLASVQYLDDTTWTDLETDLTNFILHNPVNELSTDQNSFNIESLDVAFPLSTGKENIRLTYQAGYSTVPSRIRKACLLLASDLFKQSMKGDSRLGLESVSRSEGGGNSSTRYKDVMVEVDKLLEPYKRKY